MSPFKQGDRVVTYNGYTGEVVDSNGPFTTVRLDNGLLHTILTKWLRHAEPVKVGQLVEHVNSQFDGAKRVSHIAEFHRGGGEYSKKAFVGKKWWTWSELRVLTEDDLYKPPKPETLTLQVKFDNPQSASGTTGMLSAVRAALDEFGVTGFTIEVVDNA